MTFPFHVSSLDTGLVPAPRMLDAVRLPDEPVVAYRGQVPGPDRILGHEARWEWPDDACSICAGETLPAEGATIPAAVPGDSWHRCEVCRDSEILPRIPRDPFHALRTSEGYEFEVLPLGTDAWLTTIYPPPDGDCGSDVVVHRGAERGAA